jgi:Predicted glycosyltransferases
VRHLAPHARLIENSQNLGFGRANNLALESIQTRYALLLNPDCEARPDTVVALLRAAARHPDAALLSPLLYDRPGVLGLCYRPAFFRPQPKTLLPPEGDVCSDFLSGAALLLRMAPLRALGFFDPWFFLYGEDDDLCLRVRAAGHSLVLVADAAVVHRPKQSSAPSVGMARLRAYCLTVSKLYLMHKHMDASALRRQRRRALTGAAADLLVGLITNRPERRARGRGRWLAAWHAPEWLSAPRCPRP